MSRYLRSQGSQETSLVHGLPWIRRKRTAIFKLDVAAASVGLMSATLTRSSVGFLLQSNFTGGHYLRDARMELVAGPNNVLKLR